MSINLIREVFAYAPADLIPSERLVLLALAEDARDDRIARYSSNDRLMQRTGLSRAGLSKAVRALEAAGLVRRIGTAHKGRIQQYKIAELHAHHQATNVHYLPTTEAATTVAPSRPGKAAT